MLFFLFAWVKICCRREAAVSSELYDDSYVFCCAGFPVLSLKRPLVMVMCRTWMLSATRQWTESMSAGMIKRNLQAAEQNCSTFFTAGTAFLFLVWDISFCDKFLFKKKKKQPNHLKVKAKAASLDVADLIYTAFSKQLYIRMPLEYRKEKILWLYWKAVML